MKHIFSHLFSMIAIIGLVQVIFAQIDQNENPQTQKLFESAEIENVKSISRQVEEMRDPNAKALTLGEIADLVWKKDEVLARDLFVKSLAKLAFEESDSAAEVSSKNSTFRKVISLIARHDPHWTRDLVKAHAEESKKRAETNLEIAENLLETDPKLASDFADQSIQTEITDGLLWFLKDLRRQSPADADRLFRTILQRYPHQANVDAKQFAILGTYLFTSPNLSPQDYQSISMTRVGNIIFPNITTNLPNISANLVQQYVENAILVINRPSNDHQQRQFKYTLGYLLLPKAQEFAPNLIAELSGAMASLNSFVPADITNDEAYSNIRKKTSGNLTERIAEIEKLPDSYTRDRLLLDVVFQAWKRNDFALARIAASKIQNKEICDELEHLTLFGEGRNLLEKKQTNLTEVMVIAEKLPVSLEKSLLWLGIARFAEKTGQTSSLAGSLNSAVESTKRLNDPNMPFLLTFICGEMAESDAFQANILLREAINRFNKSENITNPSLTHKISLDPLTLHFPLAVEGVDLGFQQSFRKVINRNKEEGVQIIRDLKNEHLRGQAFVALAESILTEKTETLPANQEKVIKVGEDGIRKSAKKIVMPVYPRESYKDRVNGVAVAEIQYNGNGDVVEVNILESPDLHTGKSVTNALRKWEFRPSELNGKPVSIRGKLTFYFVINGQQGKVENPKQFQ